MQTHFLKQRRESLDLSLQEMANKFKLLTGQDITRMTIHNYENWKRPIPLADLQTIAFLYYLTDQEILEYVRLAHKIKYQK